MNAMTKNARPPRRRRLGRFQAVLTANAVAAVALVGCSTESESPTQAAPATTVTPATTIAGFDLAIWSTENRDLFDETTAAMTLFADAVEAGEVEEAQATASDVRDKMTQLADGLADETRPAAVDLRDDLVECSGAYGAVEEALANADPEAFEASTPLFRACLGIAGVDQP